MILFKLKLQRYYFDNNFGNILYPLKYVHLINQIDRYFPPHKYYKVNFCSFNFHPSFTFMAQFHAQVGRYVHTTLSVCWHYENRSLFILPSVRIRFYSIQHLKRDSFPLTPPAPSDSFSYIHQFQNKLYFVGGRQILILFFPLTREKET